MSASSDLQAAIDVLLKAPRTIAGDGSTLPEPIEPVACPVLMRRPKELESDIQEAILKQTLGIYIQPPLPTRAMQGVPYLFFEGYEVRIRVVEQPKLNDTGSDGYETAEKVALLLHWTNPGGMLAVPMQIAGRPEEMIEDPTYRVIDVIFNAVLQINF
jgi:hypothetical protein